MNGNLSGAVGKVTRKLDKVERNGRSAWRLTASRLYETSIEDAWDALTNHERIPRWFLPIKGDLRVGGRYQFEGNAGGVVERCEPPHTVALTWEMHGDISWVTVSLVGRGAATLLTLEHVAHVPDAIFDQYGPGGVGVGWDLGMLGLGEHFRGDGVALDPKAAEEWILSPDGRLYVEACSADWGRASAEAGTDEERARSAAAAVVEFYSPRSAAG